MGDGTPDHSGKAAVVLSLRRSERVGQRGECALVPFMEPDQRSTFDYPVVCEGNLVTIKKII